MRVKSALILSLLLAAAVMSACTRERPTPEATAAPTAAAETAASATPGSAEPVVEAVDSTPTPEAEETATPTPEPTDVRGTFQYTVQAGDTIASIAASFSTSEQKIRELNFLPDDNIFAGQILIVPEGEPTPTPEPFKHVVQAGETLFSIAALYGVQPFVLVEVNNIQNPDALAVGTELLIPGVASPSTGGDSDGGGDSEDSDGADSSQPGTIGADTSSSVTHIVQPGETLNSIAADYGVDSAALASANNLTNRNLVRVGQVLVIPGITEREALEARGTRHTVQTGESLSQIAQQYGVTVEQILAVNGLDDPNTIIVGQELLIPR